MADFNEQYSHGRHEALLDRVREVRDILDDDIVEYYNENYPNTEGEELDAREDIYRQLQEAYQKMERIITDLDGNIRY